MKIKQIFTILILLNTLFFAQNINLKENNKKKTNHTLQSDDYTILCPNTKGIKYRYKEGIESIDCELFTKFPKRMKLFMKLREARFKTIESNKPNSKQLIKKIDKIKLKLVKPIVVSLRQDIFKCYSLAEDTQSIRDCDYSYLKKTDPLLFDNASYKMEQYLKNKKLTNIKLNSKQKNWLLDSLKKKLSNKTYLDKWRNMVE